MVLWEITLATAYFMGLRRTYRLALRTQRRLIGPHHPRTREFLHRRTRSVFNIAVRVHQSIQQRDIQVGRNLGNWMLRWLNRMKPSAKIGAPPGKLLTSDNHLPKHVASSAQPLGASRPNIETTGVESKGRLFFTSLNIRPKSFPTIAMMMQPMKSIGMNGQFRNFIHRTPYAAELNYRPGGLQGVFRKDIASWMLQN